MQELHWVPIYTTSRRVAAFLGYPYLFDTRGRWIGFVTPEGAVHAIDGRYVGFLSPDPRIARILREEKDAARHPTRTPPPPPNFAPKPSWTVPLPPQPPPLPTHTIDVLEHAPELLPPYESQP